MADCPHDASRCLDCAAGLGTEHQAPPLPLDAPADLLLVPESGHVLWRVLLPVEAPPEACEAILDAVTALADELTPDRSTVVVLTEGTDLQLLLDEDLARLGLRRRITSGTRFVNGDEPGELRTCHVCDGDGVLHHPDTPQEPGAAPQSEQDPAPDPGEAAADWSDYRRDYGVSEADLRVAHQAFLAGWTAGRHGEQAGVLR